MALERLYYAGFAAWDQWVECKPFEIRTLFYTSVGIGNIRVWFIDAITESGQCKEWYEWHLEHRLLRRD